PPPAPGAPRRLHSLSATRYTPADIKTVSRRRAVPPQDRPLDPDPQRLDHRGRHRLGRVGAAGHQLLEAPVEADRPLAVLALGQVRLELGAGGRRGLVVQVEPDEPEHVVAVPALASAAYFGRTHSCPSSSSPRAAADSQ